MSTQRGTSEEVRGWRVKGIVTVCCPDRDGSKNSWEGRSKIEMCLGEGWCEVMGRDGTYAL